jgi:hypothetical protein
VFGTVVEVDSLPSGWVVEVLVVDALVLDVLVVEVLVLEVLVLEGGTVVDDVLAVELLVLDEVLDVVVVGLQWLPSVTAPAGQLRPG